MRKLIIGLLTVCLVNVISVKGSSLKLTVNENPVQNEKVNTKEPLFEDDRNKNIRNENKRLRKEKAKYRKLYRTNKRLAREQNRLNEPDDRVNSGHKVRIETRSVGGI